MSAPDPASRADAVAAALTGLRTVRRHAGSRVTTHLPGRTVPGVRLQGESVHVALALVWPATVGEAEAEVRAALAALDITNPEITIDDVVLAEPAPASPSEESR